MFGLWKSEEAPKLSASEMIERLCERIASSSLLEDRRTAVRSLLGMTNDNRVDVGSRAMDGLVNVIKHDRHDGDIVNAALDTLIAITTAIRKGDAPPADDDVGVMFTEMFVKNQDNVSAVLTVLEDTEYSVRLSAIKLLTTLLSNRSALLQERILSHPQGLSQLMDLLQDTRDVIRNEALLLLIELTKNNASIQKIVAFENAFDRIFDVIAEEGQSDGGIVVEDCLRLARNLLRANDSNMTYFRESSYTNRLLPFFQFSESPWTPQRQSNVHLMFALIRDLVSPNNSQSCVSGFQNAIRSIRLLESIASLVLNAQQLAPGLIPQAIGALADVIRGNNASQDMFMKMASTDGRSALVVLLCIMFDAAKQFPERTAALYCYQSALFRYPEGQVQLCATLLPVAVPQGISPGQLMCQGLFTIRDPLSNWFAAMALGYMMAGNTQCKETALRVAIAREGGKSESLLCVMVSILAAAKPTETRKRYSMLLLLSLWVHECPAAVRVLLSHPNAIATLTALMLEQAADSLHLVEGAAAVVLGLAIVHNDDNDPESKTNRNALRSIAQLRIGLDVFLRLIDLLLRSDYIARVHSPQVLEEKPENAWIESSTAAALRAAATVAQGALAAPTATAAPPPSTPTRAVDPDAEQFQGEVVAHFKSLIQQQDEKRVKLEQDLKKISEAYTAQQAHSAALQANLVACDRARQQAIAVIAERDHELELSRSASANASFSAPVVSDQTEGQDELKALRADLHEVLEQVNNKDEKIGALIGELQQSKSGFDDVTKQCDELRSELQSARAQIAALQTDASAQSASQLQSVKEDADARIAAVEKSNNEMQENVAKLEELLKKEKESNDALNKAQAVLQGELNTLKKTHTTLSSEHDDLLICLTETDRKMSDYRQRLRAAGQEVSDEDDDDDDDNNDDESGDTNDATHNEF